jgi:hypothetical protein
MNLLCSHHFVQPHCVEFIIFRFLSHDGIRSKPFLVDGPAVILHRPPSILPLILFFSLYFFFKKKQKRAISRTHPGFAQATAVPRNPAPRPLFFFAPHPTPTGSSSLFFPAPSSLTSDVPFEPITY